jgi:hypothetical protein
MTCFQKPQAGVRGVADGIKRTQFPAKSANVSIHMRKQASKYHWTVTFHRDICTGACHPELFDFAHVALAKESHALPDRMDPSLRSG